MKDNENLHNEVEQIKSEYKQKELFLHIYIAIYSNIFIITNLIATPIIAIFECSTFCESRINCFTTK